MGPEEARPAGVGGHSSATGGCHRVSFWRAGKPENLSPASQAPRDHGPEPNPKLVLSTESILGQPPAQTAFKGPLPPRDATPLQPGAVP